MAATSKPAPPPPEATPPAPAAAPPAAPEQPPAAAPPAPEPPAPATQGFPQITPDMASGDWEDSDPPGLGIPGRPTGAESMPTSMDPVLKYAEDDDPEIVAKRQIRENLG